MASQIQIDNAKEPEFNIDEQDFIIGDNGDIVFTDKVKFQNGTNGVLIQKGTYLYDLNIGIDYDDFARRGSNEYVFKLFEENIRKQYQEEGLEIVSVKAQKVKPPFFTVIVEFIDEDFDVKTRNLEFNVL